MHIRRPPRNGGLRSWAGSAWLEVLSWKGVEGLVSALLASLLPHSPPSPLPHSPPPPSLSSLLPPSPIVSSVMFGIVDWQRGSLCSEQRPSARPQQSHIGAVYSWGGEGAIWSRPPYVSARVKLVSGGAGPPTGPRHRHTTQHTTPRNRCIFICFFYAKPVHDGG